MSNDRNKLVLVIDRDSSIIIDVIYDGQQEIVAGEGGRYEDMYDSGGNPVLFVNIEKGIYGEMLTKWANRRLSREEILQGLKEQAITIGGTTTITESGGQTSVSIKNANGEYLIHFNVEEDYMSLQKLTNVGARDGVSGECNDDILGGIIQDIDESEEENEDENENED